MTDLWIIFILGIIVPVVTIFVARVYGPDALEEVAEASKFGDRFSYLNIYDVFIVVWFSGLSWYLGNPPMQFIKRIGLVFIVLMAAFIICDAVAEVIKMMIRRVMLDE